MSSKCLIDKHFKAFKSGEVAKPIQASKKEQEENQIAKDWQVLLQHKVCQPATSQRSCASSNI